MPDHPSRRDDISAAMVELHGGIIDRWSPATRKRFGLLLALIAALAAAGSLALPSGPLPRVDLGFLIFVCLLVVLGTGLLALFGISADGG